MKCPHCHTTDLLPTMIDDMLPAMGCGTCHGALVSLLYYRHWAEAQKAPATEPAKFYRLKANDSIPLPVSNAAPLTSPFSNLLQLP